MSRKSIHIFAIWAVTVILIIAPPVFAQTTSSTFPPDTGSFLNNTFWQNVAVAILSAVLAFLSGYVLSGLSRKKGRGKKLSYNLSITNGVVQIDDNVKKRVKILYDNEQIDNLYDVEFELENTGDTVVKLQEIRFEFPENTRVLDFSFKPDPEPEMGVTTIESGALLKSHERKLRVGQIEKGEKVGVQFAVTNKSHIQDVKIHPFNEIGDVEFSAREIAKQLSDKEQVTKFLIYLIFYLLIPPVFDSLPVLYGEIMAGAARLLILLNLFKLIAPFSEAIADLITRLVSFVESKLYQNVNINIDGNASESTILAGDSNIVSWVRNKDDDDASTG